MNNLSTIPAQTSIFTCPLTSTFSERPTLSGVAGQILAQQWQLRETSPHDPLTLYLSSKASPPRDRFTRPLHHVLIERYCRGTTLNLDDKHDQITTATEHEWGQEIDLHSVEVLINDCGPLLMDIFEQALVDYWNRADDSEQTLWQWYSQYLATQFQTAIDASVKARTLTPDTTHMASLVKLHAATDAHERHADLAYPKVSLLTLDLSRGGKLEADLAAALLLEPRALESGHTSNLLYTLTGQLLPFASRQAVLERLTGLWPQLAQWQPQLHLDPLPEHVFEMQARRLLDQHLQIISAIARRYRSQFDAVQLSMDVDRLTSMQDLCSRSEQIHRQQLIDQLPDWLLNTDSVSLTRFGSMLDSVARTYNDANGLFWLDDVDDAEYFAYKKLAVQLHADHPDNDIQLWDVEVINHQVDAVAIPGQDTLITEGTVTPVSFSLAQLAIGNLGLLKPGQIELKTHSGQILPEWFTADYLRTLISETDIGASYPQMLRESLLDNEERRKQRQRLFSAQLATQIPVLAMERHLQGGLLSMAAVEGISQVFQQHPSESENPWVLRPMGLIREPGATPDEPENTWLIEPENIATGPCVLYRPLHPEPLQQFADRTALFAAISTPGDLQDDLLQRLPEEARRVYANGGFMEPHLPFSVEDSFALPTHTPAPPQLSIQAPLKDLITALYPACVEEIIAHFKAQSASTSETRWQRWKQFGWLLFNTLLPLAGPTLARAAWVVQMNLALIQYVGSTSTTSPTNRHIALANLLSSLAVLLFSRAQQLLDIQSETVEPTDVPNAETVQPSPMALTTLDYRWAHPDRQLSATQRQLLQQFEVSKTTDELGLRIASGAQRGLYQHNEQLWARVGDTTYRVALDPDNEQPRIVGQTEAQAPGPWLKLDQQGRWQLDLGLRLRGGMPPKKRVTQRMEENQQKRLALRQQYDEQHALIGQHIKELSKLTVVAEKFKEVTVLNSTLEKLRVLYTFWDDHLSTLESCNKATPLSNYRSALSLALFQKLGSQWAIRKTLIGLITLHKEKFDVHFTQLKAESEAEVPGDIANPVAGASWQQTLATLDEMTPLLNDVVVTSEQLPATRRLLQQQDSSYRSDIQMLNKSADELLGENPDKAIFYAHMLRIEINYQKLILQPGLNSRAVVLLRHIWNSLDLFKSQRLRLYALTDASADLKAQLLSDMDAILVGTSRRLGNLETELGASKPQKVIDALRKDLTFASRDVQSALSDYPPTATVEQLKRQSPGLIETRDQGLLFGKPRVDDNNLVDIFDADDKVRIATYREGQSGWEKVTETPAAVAPGLNQQSWAHLIKKSNECIQGTRQNLRFLESRTAWDYLPADVEDMLLHQRDRLAAQHDILLKRLAEDTAAGTAVDAASAQETIDNLSAQILIAQEQAHALRIAAALRQVPRMGELEYLIKNSQIEIRAIGSRKLLPKVKGRMDDYIDEYEIRHNGQPLWYAHFHYLTNNTEKSQFVAGHLKSAAQRYWRGRTHVDTLTGQVTEVHRAPISTKAAAQYFFSL